MFAPPSPQAQLAELNKAMDGHQKTMAAVQAENKRLAQQLSQYVGAHAYTLLHLQ